MLQNPLKDIVPKGTVKNGSWKALCNCCPYGYHIDLDFVQYCEALSQGRELAIGKQQRRERRRQRQSMEVLLGLTSPLVWNLEQQLPKVPAELSPPEPSPDSAYTSAIVQDALHRAVLDFEEALHRSQPRSVISSTVLETECPREKTIGEQTDDLGQGTSMRHAESVSSVSSMSMASSLVTPEKNNTQSVINHNIPHDDAGLLQDFDVASVGSAASGLSTGALQNIREQMAISLERMRELEEQVKLIPVLQVQLSVLKEEKRKMLLQVRLEEAERAKINIGSDSSTGPVILGDEDKCIPEPSMRVRSHSCSEGSDRYYTQNSSFSQIKSNLRDVGVTCSVVTREVGVSPQQPKLRSVKTNTHIPFNQLDIDGNKTEEFLPNLSYYQKNPATTPSRTKLVKVSPVSINISPILNKVIMKSTAMNTDLVMNSIYSDVEMDKNINKAIQIYEKTIDSCLHSQNGRDFGVQVDKTPEVAPVLLIVERRDVAVQFENMHCYIDAFSQTEELSRRLVDVGILARPSSSHTLIQVKAKTRDIGISENSVFDVLCDKCKVKKQSIGVGHNFMNVLSKDEAAISLSNIGIMRNMTSDSSVPTSRTIGCNTSNCTLVNRGTNTRDYSMGKRDFGVNTAKRKLVDAAIGDNTIHRNSDAGVFLCDKCDAVIQNVAKHMLTKNAEPHVPSADVAVFPLPTTSSNFKSPSVTPSRIPRPASSNRSATTSVTTSTGTNEKHRIQRQDTYTKLQISTENLQNTQLSTQEKASYGCEISPICPVERLLAMEASRSRQLEEEHTVEHEEDLSGSETEEMTRRTPQEETHSSMDPGLFQPIQQDTRKKMEPSKEMKAALKVLNDYLRKSPFSTVPRHLKNATNIIQQEWFKISSTASANPLDVEDYLDCFEEMSSSLLEYIVNMTDISGNTAMHYAVSHGNFDVVSILLDSKVCNINRPNAAGYTCVMLVSLAQVCSDTHRQVVRRLFQLADVNVRAKQHGQTALMLAVSHGRLDMVRLLVEAGADMNIQDEDGSTALMCAAEHGHTAIVKHLLSQQDCDVSIVDCDGSTALNIAMDAGNKDIGVLLYAHEHFSRGSSPYTSLRHRRSKSATPTMLSTTPPSPSPVRERLSRHEQTM